jgi:hypothetical protein
VRYFERSAELCEFALAACRARLRACAVLAMTVPYPVPVSSARFHTKAGAAFIEPLRAIAQGRKK